MINLKNLKRSYLKALGLISPPTPFEGDFKINPRI